MSGRRDSLCPPGVATTVSFLRPPPPVMVLPSSTSLSASSRIFLLCGALGPVLGPRLAPFSPPAAAPHLSLGASGFLPCALLFASMKAVTSSNVASTVDLPAPGPIDVSPSTAASKTPSPLSTTFTAPAASCPPGSLSAASRTVCNASCTSWRGRVALSCALVVPLRSRLGETSVSGEPRTSPAVLHDIRSLAPSHPSLSRERDDANLIRRFASLYPLAHGQSWGPRAAFYAQAHRRETRPPQSTEVSPSRDLGGTPAKTSSEVADAHQSATRSLPQVSENAFRAIGAPPRLPRIAA